MPHRSICQSLDGSLMARTEAGRTRRLVEVLPAVPGRTSCDNIGGIAHEMTRIVPDVQNRQMRYRTLCNLFLLLSLTHAMPACSAVLGCKICSHSIACQIRLIDAV